MQICYSHSAHICCSVLKCDGKVVVAEKMLFSWKMWFSWNKQFAKIILKSHCKTVVFAVHWQWRYHSLALIKPSIKTLETTSWGYMFLAGAGGHTHKLENQFIFSTNFTFHLHSLFRSSNGMEILSLNGYKIQPNWWLPSSLWYKLRLSWQ